MYNSELPELLGWQASRIVRVGKLAESLGQQAARIVRVASHQGWLYFSFFLVQLNEYKLSTVVDVFNLICLSLWTINKWWAWLDSHQVYFTTLWSQVQSHSVVLGCFYYSLGLGCWAGTTINMSGKMPDIISFDSFRPRSTLLTIL